jgi:uncharacterized protein (TIGR02284 family)
MTTGTESLNKLATLLIDTKHGYEEALKADSGSDLAPLFEEMTALREQDLRELRAALSERGEEMDDDGSLMSFVQRTVIDIRSALTGLDENALPSFIRGEESVVSAYEDALQVPGADPNISALLVRQKQLLQDKIAKMKSMQTA